MTPLSTIDVFTTYILKRSQKLASEKSGLTKLPDGGSRWFKNGVLHREDGPAVEYPDGSKYWYLNGFPHREDGPAKENSYGAKQWYLYGRFITDGERPENWDELVILAQVKQVMED